MSIMFWDKLGRRQVCAFVIALVGFAGSAYGFHIKPHGLASIFETAKWIFVLTFSSVAFFIGLLGLLANRLDSYHLKVIDLIWVSASAVAVSLAAVHTSQQPAVEYRKTLSKKIEESRIVARSAIADAYSHDCLSAHSLSDTQCENLRRLGIAVEGDGYLSPEVVGAICPRPVSPDALPTNFDGNLLTGCMSANYVAYAPEDPVMVDESDVERWGLYTVLWPLLMIFLISLRVAKSAGEVFWKIGAAPRRS